MGWVGGMSPPQTPLGVCHTDPRGGEVGGRTHLERGTTMLGLIVTVIIVGLVAGLLARLVVPGKQNLSIGMTILIGIIGSFVGGFLGYLLFHKDADDGFLQPAGLIGSVLRAVLLLPHLIPLGGP